MKYEYSVETYTYDGKVNENMRADMTVYGEAGFRVHSVIPITGEYGVRALTVVYERTPPEDVR